MKIKQLLKSSALTLAGLALVSTSFAQLAGSGTAEDPFLIQSAEDLVSLSDTGIGADWNVFLLTTNIDMTGQTFYGIAGPGSTQGQGKFKGTLDGGGHEIRNLTITPDPDGIFDVGLIPWCVDGSKVMNLGIRNITIDAPTHENIGGIAGRLTNKDNGLIENCYVVDGTINSLKKAGGIVGSHYQGTVRNCYTDVKVISNNGWSLIGGISGHANVWGAEDATVQYTVVYDSLVGGNNESLNPIVGVQGTATEGSDVIGSYYTDSVTTNDFRNEATHIALGNLSLEASYPELDFENYWKIQDGRAVLKITPSDVPVANAGADQDVIEGVTVNLSGAASMAAATTYTLSYEWTSAAGYPPLTITTDGSAASFDVPTGFSADTALMVLLQVTDELDAVSEFDTVMINIRTAAGNTNPEVNAGADVSVQYGGAVTLTATASDADGDAFTQLWSVPAPVSVDDASLSEISFTAPEPLADTVLVFTFTATDAPVGGVGSDQVEVLVYANVAPVATASADNTSVRPGATVNLSATNISDANGDDVTLSWTASDGIAIINPTAENASFIAPTITGSSDYTITLSATDGKLTSTSTVTVTVGPNALEEISAASVAVYPNPSTGSFTVEVPVATQLRVTNLVGELMHVQDIQSGSNAIDLTALPQGVYLLHVVESDNLITRKVQIQ